jgi:hypothetical protein
VILMILIASGFITKRCWILSKVFSASIKRLCYFCPLFSLCAILFLLIYYFELTCICSMKPNWWWHSMFFTSFELSLQGYFKDILICVHQWIWCLISFFYPVCVTVYRIIVTSYNMFKTISSNSRYNSLRSIVVSTSSVVYVGT